MADKKISALTAASTPLAGTEVLPIVQSSATVKVAVDDLTVKNVRSNATTGILQIAGPGTGTTRVMTTPDANFTAARIDAAQSFTGDQTLATGNLIQGTAAKGVNFIANTPAAGMTSQLLNWYETGSWTVTLHDAASGGNTSATTVTGYYTRVGNLVVCSFAGLNAINTAGLTAGNVLYVSLPFTASSTGTGTGSFACENIAFGAGRTNAIPIVVNIFSRANFRAYGSGTSSRSLIVSDVTSGSANIDYFTLSYRA